ncbi:MAG TPA: fumarylacetoacetate hydrolase family protein [Gammaproteobacteria bacterium]|jgi:2-keto-4-pentenoate hydratase/2-oxohepta-3-ene-1,7-dioic acid hydratase in catechol pathway|nr:fumarylacetoacetate hydrolase family protein [Gammaproteobacteria bacterium]
MKLASVRYKDRDLVAAEIGPGELVAVESLLALPFPTSVPPRGTPHQKMRDLIRSGPPLLHALHAALDVARNARSVERIPASAVRWHPPVRRPGKICAVAMNNSASNERKISAPDHPAFFLKPASCLVGHGEPIRIRSYYGSVHPEPELALVIGREIRDIPAARALDAVFGYTIFDDITGNGMRAEDRFHYYALYPKKGSPNETERVEQHLSYAGRYKGSDTFGALGPWLVTKDEIANPDDLSVRCSVGGELVADDSTRYYNYKVAEVVSFISQFQTLQPGDVVSLGTAFKPGAARKSIHTANLQTVAGPIEITIEGLGVQVNPVTVEKREVGSWRLS